MNNFKEKKIVKSSGKLELFSEDKIKRSLRYAGFIDPETELITHELKDKINSEILTTDEVFHRTKEIVFKKSHIAGYKYSLKFAMMSMGPDGFIFEKFIARMLEAEDYQVLVGQMKEGHCVTHEVDIIATKEKTSIYAECKFHNSHEIKNDLKVALYVKARMDDLKTNKENFITDFFLVSNTSFSREAIKYSECSGVKLLGFNYPLLDNLYQLIDKYKHYPISCIPWLTKKDINFLFSENIILIHDLYTNLSLLKKLGYHVNEIEVFKETYEKYLSRKN